MTSLLATTYGWDFYLLAIGWPAVNWIAASIGLLAIWQRRKPAFWIFPPLLSLGSGLWLLVITAQEGRPDTWHVAGFFVPGLIGLIAITVIVARHFSKPS